MKPGSFLLFSLLLFFLYSNIAAQEINLRNYCKDSTSKICPLIYAPICGSNGRTYANLCYFCNAYVESGRRLQMRYHGECVNFEDAED